MDAGRESAFKRLVTGLDYPLYVVTTAHGGERAGCLIGFATQCSIHPPRFLACISHRNHTLRLATLSRVLAVHVIEERNKDLAEVFGGETGDTVDKFAGLRWHEVHGVPVLDDCNRWFAGSVLQQFDFGDHTGFLLEPLDTEPGDAAEQLTYQQARDIEPGHRP